MSLTNEPHPDKPSISADTSECLFKAVFNRIQTGIIIVDPHTHAIVDANPIALEILGSTKIELVNRTYHEFICPAKKGAYNVTDLNTVVTNEERALINKRGKRVDILKIAVRTKINNKEYLVESFVDISDRKIAEYRKIALIGFLNKSVLRIRRPLELTKMNLQLIADQVKIEELEPEEIRMELQLQTNNISQMLKNLDDLVRMVAEERESDITREFREFLLGK